MTTGRTDTGRRACERCVSTLPSEPVYTTVSVGRVFKVAANYFGVDIGAITGKRRNRKLIIARNSVIMVLRKEGMSLMNIAKLLNRDHTTIMHSLVMIKQEIQRIQSVNIAYNEFIELLYNN